MASSVLILAKISKNLEIPKIRISGRISLYAAGNDLGPFFSCSTDPGDAFCTLARPRNSFSGDSNEFGTFFVKNVAFFGG